MKLNRVGNSGIRIVSDEHFPCCKVFRNVVRDFLIGQIDDDQEFFVLVSAGECVDLWVFELVRLVFANGDGKVLFAQADEFFVVGEDFSALFFGRHIDVLLVGGS